jgi:hypothetical protein
VKQLRICGRGPLGAAHGFERAVWTDANNPTARVKGVPAGHGAGRGRAAGAEGDPVRPFRGAGTGLGPGRGAPGAGGNLVAVDLDATIVIAHSDKDQADPTR